MSATNDRVEPASKVATVSSSPRAKTYVLDTNVLIHDPQALFHFEDNNVVIPSAVLEELDRIKAEQDSERGRNAREVHRRLLELFPDANAMREGVRLATGGTMMVAIPTQVDKLFTEAVKQVLVDREKKDNQILITALWVQASFPPPTILVTKDANVALKARAIGLAAEDYRRDKVTEEQLRQDDDTPFLDVAPTELQRFASSGAAEVEGDPFALNEYLLLKADRGRTMPARAASPTRLVRLVHPDAVKAPGGMPIRPRNLEQQFLFDALLNRDISLVTVRGKAGTGKTLLTIACALAQVTGAERLYDRMLISRPIMALGKEMGFLPGSLEEKMKPWLQPYFDALELIYSARTPTAPQFAGKKTSRRKQREASPTTEKPAAEVPGPKPYDRLLKSGTVQIEALAYIRGRSIPRSFVIVDESQNLTLHEVRTIVTRMSEGSKLILMGDESQIDNPYLDERSNGLVQAAARMANQPFAAHVRLTKGERSHLAEVGANLL